MKNVYKPMVYLLFLSVLTACEEKGGPTQSDKGPPASTPAGPAAKSIVLASPGNSGLIPMTAGVSTFDATKLADKKPKRSACAVDKIQGEGGATATTFASGDSIQFSGWILNPKLKSPEVFAVLLLGKNKAYAIPGNAGNKRLDVAKAFKSRSAELSGYSIETKLDGVVPGEYSINLLQDSNGLLSVCLTKREISIK